MKTSKMKYGSLLLGALMLAAIADKGLHAEPILLEGDAECFKRGFAPEEAKVALDKPSGTLFIKSPCGWQFFRGVTKDEIKTIEATAKPIKVPARIVSAAVSYFDQVVLIK